MKLEEKVWEAVRNPNKRPGVLLEIAQYELRYGNEQAQQIAEWKQLLQSGKQGNYRLTPAQQRMIDHLQKIKLPAVFTNSREVLVLGALLKRGRILGYYHRPLLSIGQPGTEQFVVTRLLHAGEYILPTRTALPE